jgi:hypothetical protein
MKPNARYKYCNVDGQSVAKEHLGKQISTIEIVFYGVRATTVAMQLFGKHVATVEAVFSMWSVQKSYLKNKRLYDSIQFSRQKGRPTITRP